MAESVEAKKTWYSCVLDFSHHAPMDKVVFVAGFVFCLVAVLDEVIAGDKGSITVVGRYKWALLPIGLVFCVIPFGAWVVRRTKDGRLVPPSKENKSEVLPKDGPQKESEKSPTMEGWWWDEFKDESKEKCFAVLNITWDREGYEGYEGYSIEGWEYDCEGTARKSWKSVGGPERRGSELMYLFRAYPRAGSKRHDERGITELRFFENKGNKFTRYDGLYVNVWRGQGNARAVPFDLTGHRLTPDEIPSPITLEKAVKYVLDEKIGRKSVTEHNGHSQG